VARVRSRTSQRLAEATAAAPAQTIQQCQTAANDVMKIHTKADLSALVSLLTAGDITTLSTRLAGCIEKHSQELTPIQLDKLQRIAYQLDAEVISRLFDFLTRHHLADSFNDEEQAKVDKSKK
jgi:hypothetical protein